MQTEDRGLGTIEIIRMAMPEFSSVSDGELDKWIGLIRPLVSRVKFKGQYEYALALLAAHKMQLSGVGNSQDDFASKVSGMSAKGIASISEGNTSVSFDTAATGIIASDAAASEYARTVYGLQFLSLRKQLVMGIAIDGNGVRKWTT